MKRFRGRIEPVPGGGHFVVVPDAVAAAAGLSVRSRVRGTVGTTPYRSSLMKYSGRYHLGVHKATLAAAQVQAGDLVDIAIELDDQPLPEDSVPEILAKRLDQSAPAKQAWQKLAPSHRREHVKAINEAKKDETKLRRIEQLMAQLLAK